MTFLPDNDDIDDLPPCPMPLRLLSTAEENFDCRLFDLAGVGLCLIYTGSGVLRILSFLERAVKFSRGVTEKLLPVKFKIDLPDC